MNNQSISKALDMPANLFSNLGGKSFATKINEPQSTSNIVKTNNELAEDMKEYYQSGDIKLNKLSHSYMFWGIEGIGKKLIALELAKKILCLYPEKEECNCKSCIEFDTNNNLDFAIIEPMIPIEA